jgi:hypothetical protein
MDFERRLAIHNAIYNSAGTKKQKKTVAKRKSVKIVKKEVEKSRRSKKGGSVTFHRGLAYVNKVLTAAKLPCIRKQTTLALKKAREYFGNKRSRGPLRQPKKIPVGSLKKGGFLGIISALSALAAVATIAGNVSSIVSTVKKIKSDQEHLQVEKDKNKFLESYFMANAKPATGGKHLLLKKNNRGFYLQLE